MIFINFCSDINRLLFFRLWKVFVTKSTKSTVIHSFTLPKTRLYTDLSTLSTDKFPQNERSDEYNNHVFAFKQSDI